MLVNIHFILQIQQNRTGQNRTGQDRTGQDRTGQDRTRRDRTEFIYISLVTFSTRI